MNHHAGFSVEIASGSTQRDAIGEDQVDCVGSRKSPRKRHVVRHGVPAAVKRRRLRGNDLRERRLRRAVGLAIVHDHPFDRKHLVVGLFGERDCAASSVRHLGHRRIGRAGEDIHVRADRQRSLRQLDAHAGTDARTAGSAGRKHPAAVDGDCAACCVLIATDARAILPASDVQCAGIPALAVDRKRVALTRHRDAGLAVFARNRHRLAVAEDDSHVAGDNQRLSVERDIVAADIPAGRQFRGRFLYDRAVFRLLRPVCAGERHRNHAGKVFSPFGVERDVARGVGWD